MKSRRPNQVAVFIALLSSISFSAYAQDICSAEGRSKMRSANVTDTQLSRICPPAANNTTSSSVDYRDVKTAIFDAANAVGKTIYFDASYRELGTSGGRPTMLIKVDTNTDLSLWRVFFDSRYNNTVGDLRAGQRLSITCRITELSGLVSKCDLIKLSIN